MKRLNNSKVYLPETHEIVTEAIIANRAEIDLVPEPHVDGTWRLGLLIFETERAAQHALDRWKMDTRPILAGTRAPANFRGLNDE